MSVATTDREIVATGRRLARRRQATVSLALTAMLGAVAILALVLGDRVIAPGDVITTLLGRGSGGDSFIVLGLRMPRLLLGLMVGAMFGLAGAVFQSLFANPLASPDLIGISQGASAGAVVAILVVGWSGPAVSLSAFVGAVVVAGLILLFSGRADAAGSRFIIIGIALAFSGQALIGYLLTRADVRDAQSALVWLVGSIGTVRIGELLTTAVGGGILVVALAALSTRLRMLQLGDEAATGLGVRSGPTRLLLLLVAVGLAALATAAAGPVAFVAFVAAPIARRLFGGRGPALLASALVGAVVVGGGDLVAQHAVSGLQVPVGIVTGIVGAPVLLALVAGSNRSRGTL
ncbi:MAG: hypothetical protein RI885_2169 [Actinomycetota bacterium]